MADRRGGVDGLVLALTMFTVLPLRAGRVDRTAAGWAMRLAPVAGLVVGAVMLAVLLAAEYLGFGSLIAAVLAVATGALFTRGLHLDGLADLADGLGSHRGPAGALDIMKKSDIGPFGVAVLVLTLLLQVAALTRASTHGTGAAAVLVAAVTGRLAVTWACRRGVPSARPNGLGALVAGTVGWPATAVATLLVTGLAAALGIRYGVAVLAGVAVAVAVQWHATRRLGGVTGDVLGALVELATTVVLLVAAAEPP